MPNFASASHRDLMAAGFVITKLAPKAPRKGDLVLTQTKGNRARTNRQGGGIVPQGVA